MTFMLLNLKESFFGPLASGREDPMKRPLSLGQYVTRSGISFWLGVAS